jgi:hypothetical protein
MVMAGPVNGPRGPGAPKKPVVAIRDEAAQAEEMGHRGSS